MQVMLRSQNTTHCKLYYSYRLKRKIMAAGTDARTSRSYNQAVLGKPQLNDEFNVISGLINL
jgi:hypothetical protein